MLAGLVAFAAGSGRLPVIPFGVPARLAAAVGLGATTLLAAGVTAVCLQAAVRRVRAYEPE